MTLLGVASNFLEHSIYNPLIRGFTPNEYNLPNFTEIGFVMPDKEDTARIKINKLLDALGDNFEKTIEGYIEVEQVLANSNHDLIERFRKNTDHPRPRLRRSRACRNGELIW